MNKELRNIYYNTLKISELVNRAIFQNSSELLLLKIPKETKTCSKLTIKEWVSLKLAWKIFLKSVMESDFRKSSGL